MNEEKFTGKAGVYAKYRPNYPEACLDWLYGEKGFSVQNIIADIGAGTGIWSENLLRRGSRVICVEPNGDMLAAAKENLSAYAPRFVQAPAENTTLEDGSVDHITVAQAFHWFDAPRFAAECRRIGKEGASVLLIWNRREESSPLTRKLAEINKAHCAGFVRQNNGILTAEALNDSFFAGKYDAATFANPFSVSCEAFVGGCLSSSYAPRPDDAQYQPYIEALQALFASESENGALRMPYTTRAYIGRV